MIGHTDWALLLVAFFLGVAAGAQVAKVMAERVLGDEK